MIDFSWTISFGNLLTTSALGSLAIGAYYRVTKRYHEALSKITQLEKEVARLQAEIIILMETVQAITGTPPKEVQ